MRSDRRLRRLVVDEHTVYLWSFRHRHDRAAGAGGPDCRHVLSLCREGSRVRTAFVFRAGPGRTISEGSWDQGSLIGTTGDDDRKWLNLYEPGSVRLLVDEATARGLLPGPGDSAGSSRELDGWPLLEEVLSPAP